ncbi:MAG TPA: dihydrofolate reductase family protein [Gaiellaceae bacterium]
MLIYSAIASLDGYAADEDGTFEWAAPDEEVHAFLNELERPVGTYLYGRRMYETMAAWETMEGQSDVSRDYATIWRAAEKVVYSTTLAEVTTARTRLERAFDPEAVRRLKADGDASVGGPHLAAQALAAGLVDELQLYLAPVVVGGGTRALPDGVRMELALLDERRFASGFVYLRYRASSPATNHSSSGSKLS